MKRFKINHKFVALLVIGGIFIACGPSEEEIQLRIDTAVKEAVFEATSTTLKPVDERLFLAIESCLGFADREGIDISEDYQSLYLDGQGQESSGIRYSYTLCILEELEIPSPILNRIANTNSTMGEVEASSNDINLSWTYHPDNGLNIFLEIEK
tara:strand:+ start:167 stop:628 length:462 start_codon:yes stop_codon:yes gene_type:complete